MSHYQPYPKYKDSGIEWIGEVPEHWDVARLKNLIASCQNGVWGDDPLEDETDTLCIRVADFDREKLMVVENPQTYRQISQDHKNSRLVEKGDLLLEKSGGGEKTLVGANVQYQGDEKAVCSNFVAVIKTSKKTNSAWLNFLMSAMYGLKINLLSIKQATGIQNLDSEQYLNEAIAYPSIYEQQQIVKAIKTETTRIDTLIAKKTRFIELLKEKRQALITHLVTKGLNPNVPMKDSGIEWIGEVPQSWLNRKVFHAFETIGSGTTPPSKEPEWYEGGTIPWITTSELRETEIFETKKCVTLEALEKFSTLKIYPAGALAIAMYGATIGRLGFLGVPATTNQACCVLSGVRDLNLRFVYYWLLAFKNTVIEYFSEGGGQPNINQDVVANLWIPSPSMKEQQSIVESIDPESGRIDLLISKTQHSIELLKERRSAFITAAVTGQIDLRGHTNSENAGE